MGSIEAGEKEARKKARKEAEIEVARITEGLPENVAAEITRQFVRLKVSVAELRELREQSEGVPSPFNFKGAIED